MSRALLIDIPMNRSKSFIFLKSTFQTFPVSLLPAILMCSCILLFLTFLHGPAFLPPISFLSLPVECLILSLSFILLHPSQPLSLFLHTLPLHSLLFCVEAEHYGIIKRLWSMTILIFNLALLLCQFCHPNYLIPQRPNFLIIMGVMLPSPWNSSEDSVTFCVENASMNISSFIYPTFPLIIFSGSLLVPLNSHHRTVFLVHVIFRFIE